MTIINIPEETVKKALGKSAIKLAITPKGRMIELGNKLSKQHVSLGENLRGIKDKIRNLKMSQEQEATSLQKEYASKVAKLKKQYTPKLEELVREHDSIVSEMADLDAKMRTLEQKLGYRSTWIAS